MFLILAPASWRSLSSPERLLPFLHPSTEYLSARSEELRSILPWVVVKDHTQCQSTDICGRSILSVKKDNAFRFQQVVVEDETLVLLQIPTFSAARHAAFIFSLRAIFKDTESPEVEVSSGFHEENVNLMMGHTDVFVPK